MYICTCIYTHYKLCPGPNLELNLCSNSDTDSCSSQAAPLTDGVYLQPFCSPIFLRSLQLPWSTISPRPLLLTRPIRRAVKTSCVDWFFSPHTFPVPSFWWAPVTAVSTSTAFSQLPPRGRRGLSEETLALTGMASAPRQINPSWVHFLRPEDTNYRDSTGSTMRADIWQPGSRQLRIVLPSGAVSSQP